MSMPSDTSPPHSVEHGERRPIDPVLWSRRRWTWTIVSLFVAQIVLIQLLEQPLEIIPTNPEFQSQIYLVSDALFAEVLDLQDPALFALPAAQGFSGAAWLTFESPEHEFPAWDEPRRWLTLDTSALGSTFQDFVSSNAPARLYVARRPVEPPTGAGIYVPSKTLERHSELRLEGDSLMSRNIIHPVPLPSWPHTEVLPNTVVQILVDEEGYTISTTPLVESGLPQADQFALAYARAVRFERLVTGSPRALNWGRLVFNWKTTLTNNLPDPSPAPTP